MRLKFSSDSIKDCKTNCVVLFVPEFGRLSDRLLKEIDNSSGGALSTLFESDEFSGKSGQNVTLFKLNGFRSDRLILAGVGPKKGILADCYRKAAGLVSRDSGLTGSSSAAFYLLNCTDAICSQATLEGYLLGSHKHLDYKTGSGAEDKNKLTQITFIAGDKRQLKKVEQATERGRVIAEGQILVRRLAFTPSNYLTPSMLADKAKELARKNKFKCRVLDEKAIAKEKMGALLSVSVGSDEPPRFIILEYNGGRAGQKPVVLVGKGVTFDSGGISLKPGLNMHEMKQDMTGSAVVLSAIVTAARLSLPLNIVVLIPSVENMPSGKATRPGDVITSRKGKTIENINTDAEGRLILADALDYANTFKPQAVIDVATLTGATLFILGLAGAPIMGNNDKLLGRISKASKNTSERTWPLPIWDDHREAMKSGIADLVNSGGRPAGTICAGAFLEEFIGDWPWAHIDIAYVDAEPKGRPYVPKGASGFGLRLLVDVLSNWKKL